MTDFIRDENHIPVSGGVSSTDSAVTLPLKIDSATGRLLVNSASGSGDVVGPASSTDNAIARFNSTTGKLIQDSGVIVDDTDNVSGIGNITLSGTVDGRDVATDGTKLDGIEASADVTDTANVTSAGALMDSEVDVDIKTLVLPASTTISAFGASLIDDAAASNARTTLGLGSAAVVATDLADLNEATIEAAIDTLANLTSIQSLTVNLADAGADAILGWDDTASAYENLTQAEVLAVIGDSSVTTKGVVELATIAETDTGTDTARALTSDGLQGSKRNIRYMVFSLIAAGTDNTATTSIGGDFTCPFAGTILQDDTLHDQLAATTDTAGTTGTMVVDIHKNGTTIMSTNKLDIETTEKGTQTAATQPDLTTTTIAAGDILTFDVDAVHTTVAAGLKVYMAIRED